MYTCYYLLISVRNNYFSFKIMEFRYTFLKILFSFRYYSAAKYSYTIKLIKQIENILNKNQPYKPSKSDDSIMK